MTTKNQTTNRPLDPEGEKPHERIPQIDIVEVRNHRNAQGVPVSSWWLDAHGEDAELKFAQLYNAVSEALTHNPETILIKLL